LDEEALVEVAPTAFPQPIEIDCWVRVDDHQLFLVFHLPILDSTGMKICSNLLRKDLWVNPGRISECILRGGEHFSLLIQIVVHQDIE